jgi:hypothetical protein
MFNSYFPCLQPHHHKLKITHWLNLSDNKINNPLPRLQKLRYRHLAHKNLTLQASFKNILNTNNPSASQVVIKTKNKIALIQTNIVK